MQRAAEKGGMVRSPQQINSDHPKKNLQNDDLSPSPSKSRMLHHFSPKQESPLFQSLSPTRSKSPTPGYLFGKARRDLFPPGMVCPDSPPPDAYQITSPMGADAQRVSFGKSTRPPMCNETGESSPGPIYNPRIPDSRQTVSFTREERFRDTSRHSETPGPSDHHVQVEYAKNSAPSFTFGQRVNDKLYFSRALNKGEHSPPIAKYNVREHIAVVQEKPPAFSFGSGERGKFDTILENPGPGTYEPQPVFKKSPTLLFGTGAREGKQPVLVAVVIQEDNNDVRC